MASPYIGEIRIFGFGYAPKGWAMCNGQILSIAQNQALFAILGTTYGGNGVQTFALPNLQGAVPAHAGTGFAGNTIALGQVGGVANVTLTQAQIGHGHAAMGSAAGNSNTPVNNFPGTSSAIQTYGSSLDTALNGQTLTPAGGSQSHNNMQPYLVLNICIALAGIFPSRN